MTIVIGVGNDFRRDDGVGPAVVEALRGRVRATLAVTDGEPARLIGLWAGAGLAIVVDAVRAEPPDPGKVHDLGAETATLASQPVERSSSVGWRWVGAGGRSVTGHALGLGDAVALGLAVGQMPVRLRVLAVEGLDFGFGRGLTPRVAAAVTTVADRIATSLAPRTPPVAGSGLPRSKENRPS